MAYQLGALIGALGGGGQTVTTATASLFGTTWTFARIGNVVQVDTGGTLTRKIGGSIPSNMRPATPVTLHVYSPSSTNFPIVTIDTNGVATANQTLDTNMAQSLRMNFCYLAA